MAKRNFTWLGAIALGASLAGPGCLLAAAPSPAPAWEAPAALALSPDGRQLFAACARAHCILVLDSEKLAVTASIEVPAVPTGLAVSTNESRR